MSFDTALKHTIQLALQEDRALEDWTSHSCFPSSCMGRGEVRLKERAVVAGLPFVKAVFEQLDPRVTVTLHVEEGKQCDAKTPLATLEGPVRSLLAGERCALNLLQHASGIASITAAFVQEVAGLPCDILDTRKTLPSLRFLQKYAVRIGGGKNHRISLADRILIKNNHLAVLKKECAYPIREAVKRIRALRKEMPIEIEVEDLPSLKEALDAKVELILLDNMEVSTVEKAVALAHGQAYLEASGNISLATVKQYAKTGINGISIGALTHSVRAVDMHMKVF
ncbi:MAG: carboxylating nicotinate-nucleotide diphosphorylase [Chlamydiales bacterium]